MNITAERIPDSRVVLTIEVEPERVERSMDLAYRRVLPRVRVPGFRPGKAPRRVLERHVGREALLHEALDKLVPEVVEEAIKEQDLQMVDTPDLEISSLDPVVIKATVPVRPTIGLGDYRSLRVDPDAPAIDPNEADETIESLRRRYADIEPVDRPVQEGDRVRVTITGTVEDRQVLKQQDAELTARPDALTSAPGVYERLLGMSKGDEVEFDAELPEDYSRSELAGKSIHYTLAVLDVKAEILPDLNDEFAREVGESFASLAALRERIESDIRSRAEDEAKRKLQDKAVEALVQGASVEYPPQLVEREVEHMIRDITRPAAGDDRRAMERFLQQVGRNEEQIREELRPAAAERVKRTLVLAQLAESEGIAVTPEDIEEELNSLAGATGQAAQIRQLFDTPSGREMIERQIRNKRTLERLTQIVSGEIPAAEAAPESRKRAPKSRAKAEAGSETAEDEDNEDKEETAEAAPSE